MDTVKKIYARFCWLEQQIAMVLLAAITVLVFVSALTRTFGYPINWAQDAALIMFAWLAFIGGDIALHSTGLIGIDLIVRRFPKVFQKGIDILFKIVMLVFLAVLVIYGYQYVLTGYKRLITTLNVSYAFVTASVPVGAVLMIISVSINLVKSIKTPVEKWGEKA
ncbi:MAG: TRAP transporter small permease [Clostridiales bacterium]|nr:TRAP transporter small permease [Clostridiales bacterium]MDD7174313.1 TRAP transporter small permease [Clostridiales bacterium]MDY5349241.1 TRAP transporter small permease [Candidatus Ventricola sp.]MDY5514011.1 TRAP transporter small permease [Candidatus Ventricola sp.]